MESDAHRPLKYLTIAGSVLFVLWILYNGIDEGVRPAAPAEMIQYLSMIVLLTLNATLLSKGVYARYLAIAGNAVFILLFAYDFLDRGSQLTGPQTMSHIGIVALLALTSFFLFHHHMKKP